MTTYRNIAEFLAAQASEAARRRAVNELRWSNIQRERDRRSDRQFKPAEHEQRRAQVAEPPAVSPSPAARARSSPTSKWANADWYELLLAPPAGRYALVPGGCLITGGPRAWRCEEVR